MDSNSKPRAGAAATKDSMCAVSKVERLWLIQCKREKAIGPKKLAGYLDAIPVDHANRLYGIIFAAACDFPKRHAVYSAQSRATSLWPHRRHLLYGRDRSRRGHGHGRAGG